LQSKCHELHSNFAFNFNLRRYVWVMRVIHYPPLPASGAGVVGAGGDGGEGGHGDAGGESGGVGNGGDGDRLLDVEDATSPGGSEGAAASGSEGAAAGESQGGAAGGSEGAAAVAAAAGGAHVSKAVPLSCGEHTDYGLLTIVNQDLHVAALQVRNAAGCGRSHVARHAINTQSELSCLESSEIL